MIFQDQPTEEPQTTDQPADPAEGDQQSQPDDNDSEEGGETTPGAGM